MLPSEQTKLYLFRETTDFGHLSNVITFSWLQVLLTNTLSIKSNFASNYFNIPYRAYPQPTFSNISILPASTLIIGHTSLNLFSLLHSLLCYNYCFHFSLFIQRFVLMNEQIPASAHLSLKLDWAFSNQMLKKTKENKTQNENIT